MNKLALKHQFILSFVIILMASLILTVLTFGAGYLVWSRIGQSFWQPANYSEKHIPAVQNYIAAKGENLLKTSEEKEFAQVIVPSRIAYQVIDAKGQLLYGTISKSVITNPNSILAKVNTQDVQGNTVTKYLPLAGNQGRFAGLVILRYTLQAQISNANYKILFMLVFVLLVLSPFIYLSLLTWFFARRFSRLLKEPVESLIVAAQKIQDHDLDFHLSYQGVREISLLTDAFEKMRQALRDSLLREWSLEDERREMVAALSHDLNTPLTIIQGHVQTLLEAKQLEPARLQKYLQIIEQNTEFSSQLLGEMKTLIELEEPSFSLRPQQVDVLTFLEEKALEYVQLCKQKGIYFFWVFEDERNRKQQALDLDRLNRVFNNLLSNSLRFTPTGGTIDLKGNLKDDLLKFTLRDSGPGFTSADLPHLGQKFYQGNKAQRERGHHGLGLFIVKTILQMHGGSIDYSNNPDGGAVVNFLIRLPVIDKITTRLT